MIRFVFFICGSCLPGILFSQDTTGTKKNADSSLEQVVVTAFQSHQQWKAVPAAVAIITSKDLARYGNISMVPVFNTIPGVRMEERSPASYRLSLRGSLLRSPFGVRNVKIYLNDIPLTDGGGNTYLNLIDMNQLTGAEVLKGPAASVYGAETGGVVLLRSDLAFAAQKQNSFNAGTGGGSYGLFTEQTGWQYNGKTFASSFQQNHQQADGYREQSAMRKDVLKWQARQQIGSQQFQYLLFYTDLYYQTPGGITLAQMQSNPKLSRQPGGGFPGAIQQQAAIYNKTIFGAVHHETDFGKFFTLKSFVTANHTDFKNPFITDYEIRSESNAGSGTNLVFHTASAHTNFQWMNGAEWLYNQSRITDYGNRSGVIDTIQLSDNVFANQWFAFSQAQLTVNERWNFTAGISYNNQSYRYKRLTDINSAYANKNIQSVLTPRLAILYRITNNVSAYALAAKGFSPPSLAELRPSDGLYHGDLNAEYGWNYEAGLKGVLLDSRIEFDLAAYYFALKNAIVSRTNAAGAQYFVNAGGTIQKGVEGLIRYQLMKQPAGFISGCKLWSSYSFQPYKFDSYQQTGIDYSGNALTGVPKNIWVTGIDLETRKGIYFNGSINSTSSIPLTDANDAFANAYQLVQLSWGYRCKQAKNTMHIYMGIDNLLNQVYSLGNDINAAGKRYYNPAAGRNFFAGIRYRIN
jgi:iron complex outermembrane receptor protein